MGPCYLLETEMEFQVSVFGLVQSQQIWEHLRTEPESGRLIDQLILFDSL